MPPLGIVILVVLIDLIGFSVVMPLLAPFAEQYGFREWQIGLLFSAYPFCQFLSAPVLGRLSDHYGRRPLLVVSQAGSTISFLLLGLSRDFRVMLLARMLDGVSGGNILVAQAYVADVTPTEDRARGLGLIGMAFGLGFVLGPLLGGLLVSLPVAEAWRLRLPFLVAAAFSTTAWILVLARLPESLPRDQRLRHRAQTLSRRGLVDAVSLPGVGRLLVLAFLSVLAFAALEGTLSLFLRRRLGWDATLAAFAFTGLGLLSAVAQGGLIRWLVPRFGEPRLIITGLCSAACGFAALALATHPGHLLSALPLVALGQGILSPSIAGLLSRMTPPREQGAVFGTLSSASTLARMISYATANLLLGRLSTAAPYWFGFAVYLAALTVAARSMLPGSRSIADEALEEVKPSEASLRAPHELS